MIDRDQARIIADAAVSPKKIEKIFSVSEIRTRRPLIYGIADEELEGHWIAYVEYGFPYGLRSSQVVLVKKSDGTISYVGSANDEG